MYKYIFFDLDGTLIQSEFGIINSAKYALEKMGVEVGDPEKIRKFIGPPLIYSFKEFYGMSDEEAGKATKYYRECYNAGEMYNAPLYAGIRDLLENLKKESREMYVVTTKPSVFAEKVIEHHGVAGFFEALVGPELNDPDSSKARLVKRAMEMVRDKHGEVSLREFVMVGDRFYDIEGATGNDIDSIGVLYGYGNQEELKEAGTTYIVETPEQLEELILKNSEG